MFKKVLGVFLFLLFLFPIKVDAATIRVTPQTKSAVVGGNLTVKVTINEDSGLGAWEYSLTYDSNKLQLLNGDTHVVGYAGGSGENSKTYTYTFRVKEQGEANISVINTSIASYDEVVTNPTASTTVNLTTRNEVTKNYSTNNNLSSLEVEGYDLNEPFSTNTTNYSLEVDASVTKINIKATVEDKEAKLTGTGEKELHEGSNSFDIIVTSASGAIKTYRVNIFVKEKEPLIVKTKDGKEYTIVRKIDELTALIKDHYVNTTLKIKDEEVPAFKIETLDITLVALKDNKGKIKFYDYKDGDYFPYKEISSGNLTIHILDDTKLIPKNYKKYKVNINDVEFTVYKINKDSKYYLVYGENVENGKKNLYVYDSVDKTLQRYNDEELILLNKQLYLKNYIILGLISFIALLLIIFLIVLHTRKRLSNKKVIKKRLKEEKKDFLK